MQLRRRTIRLPQQQHGEGIISDYWDSKYPGTQAGGSKRKRKGKSRKTKKR